MARYELPDGKSGKFFEITLEGNRVVTVTGIAGAYSFKSDGKTIYGSDSGRKGGRTYKDADAAQKAYDKAVAAKRAEGYKRVDRPDDVVEVTTDALRDAALEAMIAGASPGDAGPYLVYADWLEHRGDPRGEFIALQHAKQQPTDNARFLELKKREQALLFAHERAWIGDVTVACAHRLKLDWRLGFIESARINATTNPTEPPLAAVLESLLRSPAGCAVRSLELLGMPNDRSAELFAALAKLPSPGLRTVKATTRCADLVAAREISEAHRRRLEAARVEIEVTLYD
ncbi:MAG: TIGR02996 domain-containing protein [Polyangiaceae bacterium]|nr:TIGR02996 domain-containing protein [Polyangiaceae bacterium]